MGNITNAFLRFGTVTKTQPLYQYDYGQVLKFTGVELPATYEVHFSNTPHGEATTMIGGSDGVTIPDAYLTTGANVYVWLFLHTGATDGETEYNVIVPVIRRASISDTPPTLVQQNVITQAIAALNSATEHIAAADAAAENADEKAALAAGKAELADQAASSANAAATLANAAATLANEKAALADQKAELADEKATAANTATSAATAAAQNANNAATYVAPVEATSTASAAHIPGTSSEYFIYNGALYIATANIAVGDTIVNTGAGANAVQVTGGAMGEVAGLKSAINLIEITNQTPGLTVEKQKYVNRTTGAIESNTSKSPNAVSGIQVEGDAFVFKIAACEVAGVRGIAFYDGNGDFIPNSGKAYTIGETTYFFTVPAGAVTMAVTTFGVDNIFSIQFVYFQNTDKTLTESDVPADAAITGDEIRAVKSIAESNASLIRSVLTTNTTTYNDTPDRGISGRNSGFILSDPNDVCTIKITPTFSSETNPYTPVLSGTFNVRLYRISRENDTITLVEQIGDDTSYSIGDEVTVNGFDGTMLFDIRNAIDSNNNIVKVGYIYSGKSWGNTLVSFTNSATTATTFANYGIGGTCIVTRAIADIHLKNVLDGKKITVIGDSITEHNYRAKTNWPMWISEWTGAVFQNLGVSGSGFIRTSPYINRISQIQTSPDIIGIAMSWNDLSSSVGLPIGQPDDTGTTTIAGYVNDFFTELITAFPTTPIIAYCQSPWGAYRPGIALSDEYIEVMTELLAKQGIPFISEMYFGSVLRPWFTANQNVYYKVDTETSEHYGETDSIHPNSEGHKVIARHLVTGFEKNIVSSEASLR